MFDREVHVGAWRMTVGGVSLYLLTTDLEQNHPDDRPITSKLYGGGNDLRLRQEWILGVGGVRVLRALGIDPDAWHANEGHAAFMMIERLRELMVKGMSGPDAAREVRAHGIFTTHTPVAAGHDAFQEDDVALCAGPIWDEMSVSRDSLLAIGRKPGTPDGRFHMTAAAIRLSARVNGVAVKHGEVSRTLWQAMWPGRAVADIPIGAVTNGVHLPTWMSDELKSLLDGHLGADWEQRRDDPALWQNVLALDSAALWNVHALLKRKLVASLREAARLRWTGAGLHGAPFEEGGAPQRDATNADRALGVASSGVLFDPEAFTIGFARRFATYKRADLIFRDLERLRALVTASGRPVQIVFAGKAHPADTPGKKVLQAVYAFTKDPALTGRIAFVEDYDMHIASRLVQGVDLWLNLPRVPLEASGTSGMKAALNGIPQLSTLDGWWPEAFNGKNGWAIPVAASALGARTPAEQGTLEQAADTADASNLYALLEQEVVPAFYDRDANGLPAAWLERMKHAIFIAGRFFTTRRMLQQYATDYYAPALRGQAPPGDPPTA
jgi:starch phosphorylase